MPFPKPPHPGLRQWDDYACDAAVIAQILIMGGRLTYPFDTARFDQRIRRKPNQPNASAAGLRLLTQQLPVRLVSYSPHRNEDYADPAKLRTILRAHGYSERSIRSFMASAGYRLNMRRLSEAIALARELGPRYKQVVTEGNTRMAIRHLRRGDLVVAAYPSGIAETHSALLIPLKPSGRADVTRYDPAGGLKAANLELLVENGLDLAGGFVAYQWL